MNLDQTCAVDLLLEATADRLAEYLLENPTDDARAGLVRTGRLQDDPTLRKINILVHPGGEDWPDELNTNKSGPDLHAPTYTIGGEYGSSYWRRRVRVQFEMFFTREPTRNTARKKAQLVVARAGYAMRTMTFRDIPIDSFGEKAHAVQVVKEWVREGGGEGDYNWRGEMRIEFLTEIEPEL